jgi:hypothetical protein
MSFDISMGNPYGLGRRSSRWDYLNLCGRLSQDPLCVRFHSLVLDEHLLDQGVALIIDRERYA